MSCKSDLKGRSGCPLNVSLEILGDRWSLLIIRDLMFRGFHTYKEFLESDEGIATNILADRLKKLEFCGIITTQRDPKDRRKLIYKLTTKGIDLAPVLIELILWGARYQETEAPQSLIRKIEKDRTAFLTEVRKNWLENPTRSVIKSKASVRRSKSKK
ncbi:MAG: helix-turn-helix domain-containing protein [Acidobacteriota bacterium]